MARFPLATGSNQNNPLTIVVDTQGKVQGITLQNVSAVDGYISEDPNRLQNVDAGNIPQDGMHLPPDANPPTIIVLPRFKGKLYGRAAVEGCKINAIQYDICPETQL